MIHNVCAMVALHTLGIVRIKWQVGNCCESSCSLVYRSEHIAADINSVQDTIIVACTVDEHAAGVPNYG